MAEEQTAIPGERLLASLRAHGFDFFSGVPCSLFGSLYGAIERQRDVPVISAVREDEAVGHAAGAYLAGRKPVVLMQNSGLGNALNAIVSLSQIYRLPFLLLVSWRGFEGRDAPEHLVMGRAMPAILQAISLPFTVIDATNADHAVGGACREIEAGRVAALVVREGTIR